MGRTLAIASIAAVVAFCAATVVVALVNNHEVAGVTMFMLYAAASWTYSMLTFVTAPATRAVESHDEELARRIGFVDYRRMALFQYVIAPWLAALSAPFLMIIGLAIALKG